MLNTVDSTAAKELAAESGRHILAKEEVTRARLALQTVRSSAQHDAKRRECEVASTLARWQKASSAPITTACITLNPQNTIGRNDAGTGRRESPSEVALLQQSLKELDEARVAVQDENIQLREVIGDVANEVKATLQAIDLEPPTLDDTEDEVC